MVRRSARRGGIASARPGSRPFALLGAAALLAAALLALLPGGAPAEAQSGELKGDLPVGGGFALLVWSGGHADSLLDAAEVGGCEPRSFWANASEGLVGYFPTSVSLVNRPFLDAYPGGVLPVESPVIMVCEPDASLETISLASAFGGRAWDRPVELVPFGSGRWLLAEQSGRVRLIDGNGDNLGTFLQQSVSRDGNEEGLLSIALDPRYPERPYLYAYYSAPSGAKRTVLSRFEVSGNAAVASSELVILEIPQPFSNHNGGAVRFGSDGMLYLGVGDGGSGGDPHGNGQNLGTLLGSVLRIDVSNASASSRYVVPEDNPFGGASGARPEIWAYGLRNPWRMAFDPRTGQLWLGDVGQGDVEEVDVIRGGGNYGWRRLEGRDCFEPPSGCSTQGTVLPVATYHHDRGCSITGGVVYRGSAIPALSGHYVYGDFCSGRIWALPTSGGSPLEIARGGSISSFAVGPDGEVYILAFGEAIRRLAP